MSTEYDIVVSNDMDSLPLLRNLWTRAAQHGIFCRQVRQERPHQLTIYFNNYAELTCFGVIAWMCLLYRRQWTA